MKFRFTGDQDVPDWVLREFATLARVSAIRVRLISGQVCNSVGPAGEAAIDYAKVEKMTTGDEALSLTDADVKSIIAAIRFVFFQGAKHGIDDETLASELQQLGLPREHARAMQRPYRNNRDQLRAHLSGQTLRISRVEDCRWRVDVVLDSSLMEDVMEPIVQLELAVRKTGFLELQAARARAGALGDDGTGEDAAAVDKVAFECTGDKFRLLLEELKAARRAMDS